MLTLAACENLLSRYAGANNDFTQRLNLVCERLMKAGNWRMTKNRVTFNVFPDVNKKAVITLPRIFNTVLAGAVLQTCQSGGVPRYGMPMSVRNGWYSYSQTGAGLVLDSRYEWGAGFIPEEGRFTTFADWTTPMYLRLKFSTTETNPTVIYVRGNFNGQPVYSGAGNTTIEGISMTYTGSSPITSNVQFDEPPYEITKPATNGRVSLYTWDGVTETLVAIYDPTETNPGWRRYRVPACETWTATAPGQLVTVCKREYVAISQDRDEVIPSNIGALRFGMEALNVEDARSDIEAQGMWDKAYKLLSDEVEDDDGAGVIQAVTVADDFHMGCFGGMT